MTRQCQGNSNTAHCTDNTFLKGYSDRFFSEAFPPVLFRLLLLFVARPCKPIDVDTVRKMVAEGIPLRRIATLLGVSHDTLTRRFASVVKPATQKRDGRPRKELDPKKVRQLASYGLSAEEAGAVLDVSPDTISRRFAADFQSGCAHRDGKLKAELIRRALKGSDTLLVFACKALCGLSDRPEADRANGDSILRFIAERRQHYVESPNGKEITAIEGLEIDSSLDIDSDGAVLDRDEPTNGNGHTESAEVPEAVWTHSTSPLS